MVTRLPRVVVAAPATGQGKTTIATGLMAALRRGGLRVSGHKVGPDYIDPGYHALACRPPSVPPLVEEARRTTLVVEEARQRRHETPAAPAPGRHAPPVGGRNLDPHLVGAEQVVPLLLHGGRTPEAADVAVVEGVMGLFDGRVGTGGHSSTAHVATLTRSPVVLVVDISRTTRTVGAIVHGLATWDPTVQVAGVVLNRAGSPRHVAEARSAIDLPVLGVVPRAAEIATPSRHLGLLTAAENDEAEQMVGALADLVTEHVDLDAVLALARSAPDLDAAPWTPPVTPPGSGRPVVAMAAGPAFTFAYAETAELLEAAGCRVVGFDPLRDADLPDGTAGLYLGGGYPEVHAAHLADNRALRTRIRDAVADGLPTVGECAGLLYLARELDGAPMVGAIDATAAMTPRLTLRYPVATAPGTNLLAQAGQQVSGHEFHRTALTPGRDAAPAWCVDGETIGVASATLHASYLHTHWAGHPGLAQRFAEAVHARG